MPQGRSQWAWATDFGASSRVSSLIDSLSPYHVSKVAPPTLLRRLEAKRALVPHALAGLSRRSRRAFHAARAAPRRLAARAADPADPARAGGAGLAPGPCGLPACQAGCAASGGGREGGRGLVA